MISFSLSIGAPPRPHGIMPHPSQKGVQMAPVQRIILDTDPGIDDAMAILLAVASPEVDLAAVTVTGGNCDLAQGIRNARAVLHTVESTA
jgi:hypothetical protein